MQRTALTPRFAWCSVVLLLIAAPFPAAAQTTEIRPVEFVVTGRVTADATGDGIERARIVVEDVDGTTVLLDRSFTDANGDYTAVFEADAEVTVGIDDPTDPDGPTRTDGAWMGAIGPNPIRGGDDVRLTLPYAAPAGTDAAPELEVYDIRGRRVRTDETWGSGVYLYRLRFADRAVAARKLLVLGPTRAKIDLVGVEARSSTAGLGRRVAATTTVRVRVERAGYVTTESTFVVDAATGAVFDTALSTETPPTADLQVGGAQKAGEATLFDATASAASDGGGLTARWDFGDGQSGTSLAVAHVYAQAGTYDVTLTVTGTHGAAATATTQVTIAAPDAPATTDAQLVGSVTDVAGNLLAGVRASIVGFAPVDTSDTGGAIVLEDVPTGVPLAVHLEKEGFAEQVVRLTLPAGIGFGAFESTLARRGSPLPIARVEDGGTTRGTDGARVTLPVEGLVDGNGDPVTGDVTVRMTPIDPGDERQGLAFPGGFEAVQTTGTTGLLLSYGTVEFVFEQNGEELQLAPDRAAEVEIPVFTAAGAIGETIGLWSMDPSTGLWREEGTGLVVASDDSPTGKALRATVTHFSWWNADRFENEPYRVIPECRINDESGLPTLEIPPGESCYLNGRTVGGGGPFGNPDTNIRPGVPQLLALPSRTDFRLEGATANGAFRGSIVVNGEPGATDEVVIGLDPVDPGGGALTFPAEESGVIDPTSEIDTFTFDLVEGQRVVLAVRRGAGSSLRGKVRLLAPNGAAVDSTTFDQNAGGVFWKALESGTHTAQVLATNGTTGSYDLVAKLIEDVPLTLGTPVEFETLPGLVQTYTFEGQAGQWISLGQRRIAGLSGGSGAMNLLRPDGSRQVRRTFGFAGFDLGLVQLDTDGQYTLAVEVFDLEGTLVLHVEDVALLGLDQVVTGGLEARQTRYFRIDAQSGQAVRGALDAASNLAGSVRFATSTGGSPNLQQSTIDLFDGADATPVLHVGTDETWFLMLSAGYSSNERFTRPYRIVTHRVRFPGNPVFDAKGRATFPDAIDRFGEVKLHRFQVGAGDGVHVAVTGEAGTSPGENVTFELYRQGNGTVFAPQSTTGFFNGDRNVGDAASGVLEEAVFALPEGGDYILAVGTKNGATGTFDVTIDRVAAQATITVDDDLAECPSADTRSLLAALAAAPDASTVDVCAGDYVSTLPFTVYANDVSVTGAGQASTTLRLLANGRTLDFRENAALVRDLRVVTERGGNSIGLAVQSPAGSEIRRVTVEPADGTGEPTGIDLGGGSGATVAECTLRGADRAIESRTDDLVVEDNTITGGFGLVEIESADRAVVRRNTFDTDRVGLVIEVTNGAGHAIVDNDITIATPDIGATLDTWAIEVYDVDTGGDQPASIVRGNRIVTNEAGLKLTVSRPNASLLAEDNVYVCTRPGGGRALEMLANRSDPDQSMIVRNNTFEAVELFRGLRIFGADFLDLDVVNNSFRVASDTLVQPSYVFLEVEVIGSGVTDTSVRLVNNAVQGPGGGTFVETEGTSTVTLDHNVVGGFAIDFAGGQTAGGANDLFGTDPQFADADLRLAPTSPGVDSGATSAQFGAIPSDAIDGTPRPQGAGVDRGAWEQ